MADITISDLELAPALTDDMVLPVENTTDTYAATLAMLRRLLNKTFVEVANADFNALTDDGFYQCTGTPTNSPEAGAINWTLQVSAESGVVVQRAFSLDDNFANLYIRRWNGVTWTAWIEEGGGALTGKANIDLDNLSVTGQAIINGKADINLSNVNNTGNAAASNLNSKGIRTVVETYVNGTNWYRVFSDGWIEQGGRVTGFDSWLGVTNLLKQFENSDWNIQATMSRNSWASTDAYNYFVSAEAIGNNSFMWATVGHGGTQSFRAFQWYACGY